MGEHLQSSSEDIHAQTKKAVDDMQEQASAAPIARNAEEAMAHDSADSSGRGSEIQVIKDLHEDMGYFARIYLCIAKLMVKKPCYIFAPICGVLLLAYAVAVIRGGRALPRMDYHSRYDPAYQIYNHPAVLNRDKMFAFWVLMEEFDQWRWDEIEEFELKDKEENRTEGELPLNMTLTQSPRFEVFHIFYIIFKMKEKVPNGDPGLFRKDILPKIMQFEDDIKNTTEFQGLCHAVSRTDLSCADDSFDSPLHLFRDERTGESLLEDISQERINKKVLSYIEESKENQTVRLRMRTQFSKDNFEGMNTFNGN